MKTVSEITQNIAERVEKIDNEEMFGQTYEQHPMDMRVEGQDIEVTVFIHDNGYVEFWTNIHWTSPLTIYQDGKISWGSGPAVVAGTPNDISRIMSFLFEIATEYTN